MKREEFQREVESIADEAMSAYEIVRAFPRPEMISFSAKVLLLEKSERVLHRVKMLMVVSERSVAMSIDNRTNAPFYPPRIDVRQSMLNFDNER